MKTISTRYSLIVLAILCTVGLFASRSSAQGTSTITVQVTGLRNASGQVCIRFWNKKQGFPTDDKKAFRAVAVPIRNGAATAIFSEVPFGSYAVSTWRDENGNGKFDTRFPGIPTEGYGISNGTRGKLGPPPFDPSVFVVSKVEVTVPIQILY